MSVQDEELSMAPIDLCVLTEPYLRDFQIQALEQAVNEADIEIPLVVVNDAEDTVVDPDIQARGANEPPGIDAVRLFFRVLDRDGAWALVYIEKKIAEWLGSTAASSRYTHIEDIPCLSDSEIRYVTPITDGSWSELPPETIRLIEERCDVVIRYGFGLLRGEILTATELGVLSFHPADIRQYRGLGAPQAWLDGRDVMGATLQRLNEEIDSGEIVAYKEVDVSECATLWEVFDALRALYPELLVEGIHNLRDPAAEITTPASLGPYYSTKSRRKLSFAGRTLLKNAIGRLRRATRARTHRSNGR